MEKPRAENYDIISFDCYGTLVDWETSIVQTTQEILLAHDAHMNDNVVLEYFADFEPTEQTNGGSYRQILSRVLQRYGTRLGFVPTKDQLQMFEECVANSSPFDDTIASLHSLHSTCQLAIISNTDRDLFDITQSNLQTTFDYVITAEDVGAYKPNVKVFEYAFECFGKESRVLHVAQSIYHDIEPANQLDLDAVWIDRTEGRPGATKETSFTPKWQFSSLKDFCESFLV
ncbi:MAG: HAD-IA family hydrolase [Gammaproteobacteria bacterium]|nr:HAD-IA family hydrolase [Gammaproteobacteria bacterium]